MPSIWRDDERPATDDSPREGEISRKATVWRPDEAIEEHPRSEEADGVKVVWRPTEGSSVTRFPRTHDPLDRTSDAGSSRSHEAPRLRAYVVTSIAFFISLFLADAVYVSFGLASALEEAGHHLDATASALDEGDTAAARQSVERAASSAARAGSLVEHPSTTLATWLPGIGTDARVLVGLANAAKLSATAGEAAVEAAETIGLSGTSFAESVYQDGVVDVEAIEHVEPLIVEAHEALAEADLLIAGLPQPRLDRLRSALNDARDQIQDAAGTAQRGRTLVSLLPGLLGGDGERKYLLTFQALGEARGTGGVVGLWGVLRADEGRLILEDVAPAGDIQNRLTGTVDAPQWFRDNYDFQSARSQWSQANLSPNFAVTSQVMLNMHEAATGTRLDGVLAMDPVTMSILMRATGPVSDPDTAEPIESDEIVPLVLHDSYLQFDQPAQNEYLADLMESFWDEMQAGDFPATMAADALAEATRSGHFKVFSDTANEQSSLATLGIDGNFASAGPNPQLVFHQNYSVNKVDYFLQRTVETSVELLANGSAEVTTEVTLENEAPDGPPSLLLGRESEDVPVGTNQMLLGFLMPPTAEPGTIESDGEPVEPFVYQDTGHPVAWEVLSIPPGQSRTVTVTYLLPGSPLGNQAFRITLVPQTSINPDHFSFRMEPPPGFELTEPVGIDISAGVAIADGELTEPRTIAVTIERS